MLFTAAKLTHLNEVRRGQPERDKRTANMVAAIKEGTLRQLHESWRLCGGVPQGNTA